MTLPSANPGEPFIAAEIEAKSSGADVPMDTIVNPTIIGEIAAFKAMPAALRTRISPLAMRTSKPKTSRKMFIEFTTC
jgi:hypothetical protein